ncbi:MAG: hypothetical protein GF308_14390 [Candidatus Heimdallarchaeota archaeon]|nr:hypothetical protein [Candidatus Heimdallarchaeota archaeon]
MSIEENSEKFPRIFVRLLYRFQFGYSKLAGILSIGNFVSLLLILLDQLQLFTVQWWHILLFYLGIFAGSVIFVMVFERLNAWEAERFLTFKISQAEIVKMQHWNLALAIVQVMNMTEEEREAKQKQIDRSLFQQGLEEKRILLKTKAVEKKGKFHQYNITQKKNKRNSEQENFFIFNVCH